MFVLKLDCIDSLAVYNNNVAGVIDLYVRYSARTRRVLPFRCNTDRLVRLTTTEASLPAKSVNKHYQLFTEQSHRLTSSVPRFIFRRTSELNIKWWNLYINVI